MRLDATRRADVELTPEQAKVVARTVAAVTDDLEAMRFNTAISRLMEFVNVFTAQGRPAEGGDGDVHPAARPAGAAHRRGALAVLGHAKTLGLRALADVRPGPALKETRSRSRSRSTASCGAE